jgi:hypothetical protein
MLHFILGLNGPHVKVVSHILKKCGLEFGQNGDENDLDNYTKSESLETFRRHLDEQSFQLEQSYVNELYGFMRNHPESFATKEFKDLVCVQYLLGTPFTGKIVYVKYAYEDINADFLESVDEQSYGKHSSEMHSFLDLIESSGWSLIEIDYKLFLSDESYREAKLSEVVGDEHDIKDALDHFGSKRSTDDPDDIEASQFEYLVSRYNDQFASSLLSNIIDNIPPASAVRDLTNEELEQYVKDKNSET